MQGSEWLFPKQDGLGRFERALLTQYSPVLAIFIAHVPDFFHVIIGNLFGSVQGRVQRMTLEDGGRPARSYLMVHPTSMSWEIEQSMPVCVRVSWVISI